MKNLHIFKNTNGNFSVSYKDFINKNFNSKDHFFYILGKDKKSIKIDRSHTQYVYGFTYCKLIKDMNLTNKIILHGLFSPQLILLLFMQPWLLKKCYWCIWGGDLYYYKYRKISIKTNIYELIRKKVIRKIGALITHIKGDYELAQTWYHAKGNYHYCFMYPSNLYKEYNIEKKKLDNAKVIIQIGNSADPSNNHIDILKKLEKYKESNIEIICSLSYGDSKYREKVVLQGKKIFGEKFKPLIDFLPFDEYLNLLVQVDVAIFNHKRQQAMGNITTLLGLGKKVYVRDDVTTWEFFIDHDLKVYNTNSSFDDLFEEMDMSVKEKNIESVKSKFSEKKLIKDWRTIFICGDGLDEQNRILFDE